jgi:hypothetical protein
VVTCHFAKEGLTVLISDGRVYIRNRACAMSLGFSFRSYSYVRLDVVVLGVRYRAVLIGVRG